MAQASRQGLRAPRASGNMGRGVGHDPKKRSSLQSALLDESRKDETLFCTHDSNAPKTIRTLPSPKETQFPELECLRETIPAYADDEVTRLTVQPGVTQAQLTRYLDEHHLPYMVPTTGAGPDASLLGNAIERGYGLTPHADHFGALTSLQAVLPNGEIYAPALSAAGGVAVDRAFKWGVGPYLDGLFTQSNLGIVTEVSIALAHRPERIEMFLCLLRRDEDLEAAVVTVQKLLRQLPGVTGSMNLMNARRMLSMSAPYPVRETPRGQVMPDEVVQRLCARQQITPWLIAGALYGHPALVQAAHQQIKRALAAQAKHIVFLTEGRLRLAKRLLAFIPVLRKSRVAEIIDRLSAGLRNLSGRPSDIAQPLSYWKSGHKRLFQNVSSLYSKRTFQRFLAHSTEIFKHFKTLCIRLIFP